MLTNTTLQLVTYCKFEFIRNNGKSYLFLMQKLNSIKNVNLKWVQTKPSPSSKIGKCRIFNQNQR